MEFSQSLHTIVTRRYSCRTYLAKELFHEDRLELDSYIHNLPRPPFNSKVRLELAAASPENRAALKNLGTYGVIRNPAAFITGAVEKGEKNLEDFGFLVEQVILFATDMDLGTCWLGGTFSRSSFAETIGPGDNEILPAVVSVGYPAKKKSMMDSMIRFSAGSKRRKSRDELFFDGSFEARLDQAGAGMYMDALEMVRRAPSASNRQPWRVMRDGEGLFHFYLERSPGYYGRNRKLFGMHDLQRMDMGIAMCHFQLAAREAGLYGEWVIYDAHDDTEGKREYIVSWREV